MTIRTPEGFVHDRRVVTGARAAAESLSTDGVSLHSVIGGTGPGGRSPTTWSGW